MSDFLKQTLELLKERVSGKELPKTRDVLVGKKFMAVLLDGYLGTGYAPREDTPTCSVISKAGHLHDMSAMELAGFACSDDPFERSIGIAALNALSQYLIAEEKEAYHYYSNLDILKILPLTPESRVGMVGMIRPFVKYLAGNSADLVIIDDNPDIPAGPTMHGYRTSRDITALEHVDVFLLTGSTLIEHFLEDAINAAKQARFKVVIGPTASWIPEIGFDLGLDAVCGMSFKDPDQAFRTIMQGGGTQSFSKYADKYTLTRKKASGQD